jgi:hypothetical protein
VLQQFDSAILEAVGRASKRSSAVVHEQMREGLCGLATIGSLAPWVGIFGTIMGIVTSFEGFSGPKWNIAAAIFEGLSRAMWFTALGLVVGLVAMWSFEYLKEELSGLDQEMENASLELLNQLSRFPGRFEVGSASEQRGDGPIFGERPLDDLRGEDKLLRRCLFLAAVALPLAWLAQASRYFVGYSLFSIEAIRAAFVTVPIMFGLSYLPAYPLWRKVFSRRRGALVALAAIICLFWSVAELVLSRDLP